MNDVEKFLEGCDKTWGTDPGCAIKFDEIKRLLRLCRRYREALKIMKQVEDDKQSPWIATSALQYDGLDGPTVVMKDEIYKLPPEDQF